MKPLNSDSKDSTQQELSKFQSNQSHESQINSSATQTKLEMHHELVSPIIWIPCSLFAAFLNALSKEIKSKVSAHHLAAMFLISPSILVTLLTLSLGFWIQSKYFRTQQLLADNQRGTFFGWIYDIYFVKVQSEDSENRNTSANYKFVTYRLWTTLLISFIEIIHIVLVYESYYLQ